MRVLDCRRRIGWKRFRSLVSGWVVLALIGVAGAVGVSAGEGEAADAARPEEANGAPAEPAWRPPRTAERQEERDRMVETIRRYGLTDPAVLRAMERVPRHAFVPRGQQRRAYQDSPLPIGHGQTISQPYIVAEMTRQLNLKPGDRVLEIGTGSGYQAAVLTEFTTEVYTIEIIEPLAKTATEALERWGYDVVRVRVGDGYYGWEEKAPFDVIIVTCAAGQIPPPLIAQLAPGGRMVIPVGPPGAVQTLYYLEKDEDGQVRSRSLMSVRFVPLLREAP